MGQEFFKYLVSNMVTLNKKLRESPKMFMQYSKDSDGTIHGQVEDISEILRGKLSMIEEIIKLPEALAYAEEVQKKQKENK